MCDTVRKRFVFFSKKRSHLTGGSGTRGKADPNWVRKVFNFLRSLQYRLVKCTCGTHVF
jgi:hypothetical protein